MHALSLTGVYDKFRLVPFGEYLPAESFLAPVGFKKLVHVTDGFDPRTTAEAYLAAWRPARPTADLL